MLLTVALWVYLVGLGLGLLAAVVVIVSPDDDPEPWWEHAVDGATLVGLGAGTLVELLAEPGRADRPLGVTMLVLCALQGLTSLRARRRTLAAPPPEGAADLRPHARFADVGTLLLLLPGAAIAAHLLTR